MASLLVDFVPQARGIAFYSSVASFGQHFTCSRAASIRTV